MWDRIKDRLAIEVPVLVQAVVVLTIVIVLIRGLFGG